MSNQEKERENQERDRAERRRRELAAEQRQKLRNDLATHLASARGLTMEEALSEGAIDLDDLI